MRKHVLLSLAAVALVTGGLVAVAHAAAGPTTASCTSAPKVVNADGGTAQKITVVCKVPKPAPVTATVRATQTATVTATATVTSTVTASPSQSPTPSPTSSPTSSPTPTPTTSPTLPTGCVRPGEANTGPTGTLAPYTGPSFVTADGTVIENRRVSGDLTIAADNVTVRNVHVTGALGVMESAGARISDTTVREFFISSAQDVSLTTSEITGSVADGMHVTSDGSSLNRDITIARNLIHNPNPGEGSHYDGLQVRGVAGLDLLCNAFDLGPPQFEYNAALYLEPANGGHSDVLVDGNWLLGGGHIFHYGADNDGKTRLTNNHFGGQPYWGANAICHTGGPVPAVQSGNDLNGTPFTPCP